jgi:hypothetical protein
VADTVADVIVATQSGSGNKPPISGETPHQRRGAAERGQRGEVGGIVAEAGNLIKLHHRSQSMNTPFKPHSCNTYLSICTGRQWELKGGLFMGFKLASAVSAAMLLSLVRIHNASAEGGCG